MLYKKVVIAASLCSVGIMVSGAVPKTMEVSAVNVTAEFAQPLTLLEVDSIPAVDTIEEAKIEAVVSLAKKKIAPEEEIMVTSNPQKTPAATPAAFVPFYSQFNDITAAKWKKVGCGVTSLAMLINYYKPAAVSVDTLLTEGIAANAYTGDTGWSHAGLIALSKKYGLTGESHDLSGSTMTDAFSVLKRELQVGPVMASVHYTLKASNPIPHLIVVNSVHDGKVFYNDPAAQSGNAAVSIEQFQSAWKKRYIDIRPIS